MRAASCGNPTSVKSISRHAGRSPLLSDSAFWLLPGASAVVSLARKIVALNLSAQNLENSFLLTSKKNIIIQLKQLLKFPNAPLTRDSQLLFCALLGACTVCLSSKLLYGHPVFLVKSF